MSVSQEDNGPAVILEVEEVFAGYGKIEVLHGTSIRVREGEIVCIIGPNGSGKSTLLKTVVGLLKPTRGSVRLSGREVGRLDPQEKVRLGMAYIPQGRNVFPSLTVMENLQMGGVSLGDARAVRQAVEEVLEDYPVLRERARQQAGNLSGGEKQILALARAVMTRPRLILLDEPSIGLAPRIIEDIYSRLQEINRGGVSLAVVEQNARKALSVADRGYVLDLGVTRLEDTGAHLLDNEEVRRLYLGEKGNGPDPAPQDPPSRR
ncbi:MAG: ABC transporter ATP-binding protein [Syntrophales bacterium]|jgi:branched-chain amino acid transport system ATP-binding protein